MARKAATPVLNVAVSDHGQTYRVPFFATGHALGVFRKMPSGRETALMYNGPTAARVIAAGRPLFDAKIETARAEAQAAREAAEEPSAHMVRRLNFWGY